MGIPLLTPDRIKDDRRQEQLTAQRHAYGLAEEENRLISSLNLTRDSVTEQREEIATELVMFEAQANDRRQAILDEIKGLEVLRNTIMAPLDNRRKAVEVREQVSLQREKTNANNEKRLISREMRIAERETNIDERERGLSYRENSILPRETAQDERERRIQTASDALIEAQMIHDKKIADDMEKIAIQASRNYADAKTNMTEAARLAEKAEEQAKKDIEIADRYAQLQKTTEEIRKIQKIL